MSDLFWLTDAQMARLPLSSPSLMVSLGSMTGGF